MKHITLRSSVLGLVLVFSAAALLAQNAYLANFSLPQYVKANTNYPISVWARNASSTPYTNFTVSWRVDGGTTYTGPNQGVGGGGITTGNYLPYTHPTQMNVGQGAHTLEVWITTAVDTDPSNNRLTIPFTALSTWANKVVLMEARTETWCPQCPASNTVTDALMADPDFAVAKFHLSDALDDCPECITYYDQHGVTYTPAGIIEMGEYGGYLINYNHSGWAAAMTSRAAGVSPVELTMSSSVNSNTRVMTVTLNARFTFSVAGPHKLNVYVTEDNVPGPQSSAPPNYIHQKVMRAMLGGANGTTGVIPNNPVVGTWYTRTYSYTVPAGFNIGNLKLIGLVEHSPGGFNDRYSLNCVNGLGTGVGIDDLRLDAGIQAFPNPFTNELRIRVEGASGAATMELFDQTGRTVVQRNLILDTQGSALMDLQSEGLSVGTYVLRISTPKGWADQRLVKID